jgi:hypothetical protein
MSEQKQGLKCPPSPADRGLLGKEQATESQAAMSPEVAINWIGGNCPVQAEGTVDGKEFYFRARGEHWSMSIGGADVVGEPEWYYEEEYSDEPFAAGWMHEAEARHFISRAAGLYLAARHSGLPETVRDNEPCLSKSVRSETQGGNALSRAQGEQPVAEGTPTLSLEERE